MLPYVFASHRPAWAAALGIPTTLVPPAVSAVPVVSGPQAPSHAVALTFDDGPHPQGTPAILELLAAHGAVATFFLVGEQVIRRPELVRRIHSEGHAIALHGYHHRLHLRRSAADLRQDFARGTAAIEDAAGITPSYHRPPYGIYSPASLRIARERGLQPLLWSAWGKDWRKFTTPKRIARRVTVNLGSGDVILLHDADFYSAHRSHEHTVKALPLILTTLESGGLGTFLCA